MNIPNLITDTNGNGLMSENFEGIIYTNKLSNGVYTENLRYMIADETGDIAIIFKIE